MTIKPGIDVALGTLVHHGLCSNDDLRLTLTYLQQGQMLSCAFKWGNAFASYIKEIVLKIAIIRQSD